jgi:hypothetical protein
MVCFGDEMVWQGSVGTWLYDFVASGGPGTGGWTLLTGSDPIGIAGCGRRLLWWSAAAGTWYWDNGWFQITTAPAQTTACYKGQIAWESPLGTWIYNFATGWSQITNVDPDGFVPWGPNLAWDGGAAWGTWIYGDTGWSQITGANPTLMEVLADHLLWSYPAGTWTWSGAGGGAAWTSITGAVPTQIVSTGAVHPSR